MKSSVSAVHFGSTPARQVAPASVMLLFVSDSSCSVVHCTSPCVRISTPSSRISFPASCRLVRFVYFASTRTTARIPDAPNALLEIERDSSAGQFPTAPSIAWTPTEFMKLPDTSRDNRSSHSTPARASTPRAPIPQFDSDKYLTFPTTPASASAPRWRIALFDMFSPFRSTHAPSARESSSVPATPIWFVDRFSTRTSVQVLSTPASVVAPLS